MMKHVERITNTQIKFKTTMRKLRLCINSDAYKLVKETVTDENIAATGVDVNSKNKKSNIYLYCAPFTDCVSEISNKQVENAKDIDEVIPMYKLVERRDNFSKLSRSLYLYYRGEPAPENHADTANFADNNTTDSFKFKAKITGQAVYDNTKNVEKMIILKYSSNFWRSLETLLINCEINPMLAWSANCVISL